MKNFLSICTGLAIAILIPTIPPATTAQPQNQLLSEIRKTNIIQYNCLTSEVWSPDKQLWCQQLVNTEWLLEDLNGKGVSDRLQSTIKFMPSESSSKTSERISGNGGCNRYTAGLNIRETKTNSELPIQIGAIASTKKLCPPAIMNQERQFLEALGRSQRLRLEGTFLFIDTNGSDKPLKFTQLNAAKVNDLSQLFSRIWQVQSFDRERNQNIYAFLPNGTLLQTSCRDKYAIATWTIDKNAPTVLKIQQNQKLRYTLRITELTDTSLRMQMKLASSNRIENVNLIAVSQESTCLN